MVTPNKLAWWDAVTDRQVERSWQGPGCSYRDLERREEYALGGVRERRLQIIDNVRQPFSSQSHIKYTAYAINNNTAAVLAPNSRHFSVLSHSILITTPIQYRCSHSVSHNTHISIYSAAF